MQLVVCQTDQEIANYKLDQQSVHYDCPYCLKRAYTTLKQIREHEDECRYKDRD